MTIKGRCKIIKTYADVVEKYNKIFGKWLFDKIISYSSPKHIQKLIEYLKIKRGNLPSSIPNEDQITNILTPALDDFLNYLIKQLFALRVFIPGIVNTKTILKPERIKKILDVSHKGILIEEFITDLEVIGKGPKGSITIADLPTPPNEIIDEALEIPVKLTHTRNPKSVILQASIIGERRFSSIHRVYTSRKRNNMDHNRTRRH